LVGLTQAGLAKIASVGPSAVAQWELPSGTSPTIDHLIEIALVSGVTFEWLATGRGSVTVVDGEIPAIDVSSFATNQTEDRLLAAFRRIPVRKHEIFVRWLEEFF
jgi:transcriptional regulator with XRE-family HTH domain